MFLVFLPPSFSGNFPSPLLSPFYFIIYLLLPKVVSNNVASPTSYLINAIKHFLTKTFGRIWNLSLMKLGAQQLLSLLSPEIVSQQKDLLVLFQISMKTCTWIYSLISKGLSQEVKFKCRFRIKLRNVLFKRGHFTCRGSYLMTWGYSLLVYSQHHIKANTSNPLFVPDWWFAGEGKPLHSSLLWMKVMFWHSHLLALLATASRNTTWNKNIDTLVCSLGAYGNPVINDNQLKHCGVQTR